MRCAVLRPKGRTRISIKSQEVGKDHNQQLDLKSEVVGISQSTGIDLSANVLT